MLAAHIFDDGLVELVAGHLDGGAFHHALQGDHGDVAGAAADVHHHVALGLGDVDAGADGGGHRLLDQIHLPGTGLDACVDDGTLLDLSDAGGHADDDPGLEEGHAGHLVDKLLEHPLRHIIVGDHALPQGTDGDDIARGAAQHGLCLGANLQELSRGLIHCHHGGFVENDALSLHIHQD